MSYAEEGISRLHKVAFRFVDQGIVSIGNFALGALVARASGPTYFGIFALIWTIMNFALGVQWAFIASPMQSSIPRTIPAERLELSGALLTHSVAIALGASIIAVSIWAAATNETVTVYGIVIVALSFVAVILQDYIRRWFLATERAGMAVFSDSIRHVGAILGVLCLWYRGTDLESIIGVIGIASFAGCIPANSDIRKSKWTMRGIKRYARDHAESGRVLVPFVAVQTAIASAPIYALTSFVSAASAGGYRVATYSISPVIILTEALETFLPLRASQASSNLETLRKLLFKWRMIVFGVSALYTAILWLSGHWVIVTFFGPSYERYIVLLYPLAISALLQNHVYIRNVELRAKFQFKKILRAEVIAACTLGVMYVLLPLGQNGGGAAVSAAISQAAKLAFILR